MCGGQHESLKVIITSYMGKYAGAIILLLVMLPAVCHAQQPAVVTASPGMFYGSVEGYVRSAGSDSAIPGAKVWLINASRENITYGTTGSDRSGHFYFMDVVPLSSEAYRVRAQSGNDTGITDPFGVATLENKSVNVYIPTRPRNINIASPVSYVVANGSDHMTLTASVKDSHGNPVGQGYPFTYTIKPDNSGEFIGSIGVPGPLQTVYNIETDGVGQVKIDYGWAKPADGGKNAVLSIYSDDDPGVNASVIIGIRSPDKIPPSTYLSLSGVHDNAGGYISNVTAMLASMDNPGGWGVKSTDYRIGDGNWSEYDGPFIITGSGADTLEYYSVDRAGNAEKPHRQIILIHR